MLLFAQPMPPTSSTFTSNDLDEFLTEAVALAERINRRLSERAPLAIEEPSSPASDQVEN